MVSAELALAVPVLVLVLAVCLAGLGLAVDQMRCFEAVRAAARAVARGEDESRVLALARAAAPEGSTVEVIWHHPDVTVVVQAPARSLLPGVPGARAALTVPLEPSVDSSAGLLLWR